MTSPSDVSPPADDSSVATEQPKNSQHWTSRVNLALAWVGIAAGGLFVVAAIFFSGFFLSWGFSSSSGHHMRPGTMDCCDQMKPDEHMKPGAMMGPGSHMTPGQMMPGGMMGPALQSPQPPTMSPSTPRP
jgi:hypothetical protein